MRAVQYPAARIAQFSGEDIICFSHTPWHGPWKASQQIMSRLAKSNRVLYVGPPQSLREAVDRLRKRESRPPVLERFAETLFVYHEPLVFAKARETRAWGKLFNCGSSQLRLAHIRWWAKQQGIQSPILWVIDPMMAYAVGTFRAKLLVYHVLDNYVMFSPPGAHPFRTAMAKNEAKMLNTADVVFTVSERLYRRCAKANPHSFLVPNGVDYDLFQLAIAANITPPDMRLLPRPIVGYVGVIQPDMDLSLLERLSAECADCSLVFVGPEDLGTNPRRFRALLSRPNVHYLGCKAVKDVPAYINACDVCIMPDRVEVATPLDGDTIKLYEYLACGRPIVSTDTPSARRFEPLVRIARDHAEFVASVKESLTEETDWQDRRKTAATNHSWQRRVELISEEVRNRLSAKEAVRDFAPPALRA